MVHIINIREIIRKLVAIENLMKKAAAGEKPVVNFKIAPELTKRVTLLLYKWILLSHIYLYYRGVQDAVKEKGNIGAEEIPDIFAKKEDEKIKRR